MSGQVGECPGSPAVKLSNIAFEGKLIGMDVLRSNRHMGHTTSSQVLPPPEHRVPNHDDRRPAAHDTSSSDDSQQPSYDESDVDESDGEYSNYESGHSEQ